MRDFNKGMIWGETCTLRLFKQEISKHSTLVGRVIRIALSVSKVKAIQLSIKRVL